MIPVIDYSKCNACEACIDVCPNEIYSVENGIVVVDQGDFCAQCNECLIACDQNAIDF